MKLFFYGMEFFMNLKDKFLRFMQGRYGIDSFSRFLTTFGLILLLVSILFRLPFLNLLGVLSVIYCYVRMFSKNTQKRFAENQKFLQLTNKIRTTFQREASLMSQRKTHHIYTCPSCKQKIRIPRGRGKIEISCPKCHTKFIRKS